jgi:Lrp/AsnC family leucine-responsive transcriptional regulator
MLDDVDRKILFMIQEDARLSNAEIARRLNMAPSGILERVRKLKERGDIKEYVTLVNPKSVDMGLLAFVFLKTSEKSEKWDVGEMVAEIPEVLEVHDIAGEDCYLVKLRTRDTDTLYQLLREKFGRIKAINASKTTIVLRTIKETNQVPIYISELK